MFRDLLILLLLNAYPQHGYALQKSLERILGQAASHRRFALYSRLKYLTKTGAVISIPESQTKKPTKYTYQLTELGEQLLKEQLGDFPGIFSSQADEFFVRVASFRFLQKEVCINILESREKALSNHLTKLEEILAGLNPDQTNDYRKMVIFFCKKQISQELFWIQEIYQITRKSSIE